VWALYGLLAIGAALAGVWVARHASLQGEAHAPELASGTWLPVARQIGDFTLKDQTGAALTAAQLRGAPTLVFFGYTHCPDVCPTTLFTLAQVRRALGAAAPRVLFVSVDPARDTPSQLAQYVSAFDPQFMAASGEPAELARVAAQFGVAYLRVDLPGGDYTMDHTAALFLLDAQVRNVAIFTPPFDAQRLAQDLRRVAFMNGFGGTGG